MAIGKVLVVEDEEVAHFIIRRLFDQRHLAEEIVFAQNGKEGIEAVKNRRFNLILLDINMPIMDGFEFLDAVTKYSVDKGIEMPPIYLLTSSANSKDKAKAAQYPIVKGYLVKPFSKEHIDYLTGLSLEGTELEKG